MKFKKNIFICIFISIIINEMFIYVSLSHSTLLEVNY